MYYDTKQYDVKDFIMKLFFYFKEIVILLCLLFCIGYFFGLFNSPFDKTSDAEKSCLNNLSLSIEKQNDSSYDETEVRTALNDCKDLNTQPASVKKSIARAEVCIGNYHAAEAYIKQYPYGLGYLNTVIQAKKANPSGYRCLIPIKKTDLSIQH